MDYWKHLSLLPGDTLLFGGATIKSLPNCLALPIHLLYQFSTSPMVFGDILRSLCPISARLESQIQLFYFRKKHNMTIPSVLHIVLIVTSSNESASLTLRKGLSSILLFTTLLFCHENSEACNRCTCARKCWDWRLFFFPNYSKWFSYEQFRCKLEQELIYIFYLQ